MPPTAVKLDREFQLRTRLAANQCPWLRTRRASLPTRTCFVTRSAILGKFPPIGFVRRCPAQKLVRPMLVLPMGHQAETDRSRSGTPYLTEFSIRTGASITVPMIKGSRVLFYRNAVSSSSPRLPRNRGYLGLHSRGISTPPGLRPMRRTQTR